MNKIKEHPLNMDAANVLALLSGRKRTHRIPVRIVPEIDGCKAEPDRAWIDDSYMRLELGSVPCLKVPYGPEGHEDATVQRYFPPVEVGTVTWIRERLRKYGNGTCQYAADCTPVPALRRVPSLPDGRAVWPWKNTAISSSACPLWASRLRRVVASVRCQRLHDMSEVEAIDEGAAAFPNRPTYRAEYEEAKRAGLKPPLGDSPLKRYRTLWEAVHGKRHPWASNCWVWVIEFEPVEKKEL